MKKLFKMSMAALLLGGFVGCSEAPEESAYVPEFSKEDITATISEETRTLLGAENEVLWSEGDAISFFNKSTLNQKYVLKSGEGTTKATFGFDSYTGAHTALTQNYAVYPWGEVTIDETNKKVTGLELAAEQSYTVGQPLLNGAPMVAVSDSREMQFKNTIGLIRVNVKAQLPSKYTLNGIEFSSVENNLAGEAEISLESNELSVVGEGKSVEVTLAEAAEVKVDEAVTVYALIPAMAFAAEDLTITLKLTNNFEGVAQEVVKVVPSAFTLERSKIFTFNITFKEEDVVGETDEKYEETPQGTEVAEGLLLLEDGVSYLVTADAGLASISALVAADENGFAGKTIKLATDIDLFKGYMDDGDPITTAPIGDKAVGGENKAFKGTFDGDGHAIKNLFQNGWALNYEWGVYGSLGLFRELEDATVKNIVIDGMEALVEGGDISFIAGSATGTCVFENIIIRNSKIATYNNGCGGIIGWSGAGNYTFKNITLEPTVVLGGLWGSFDSSIGGIVGQAEPGATYNFENVEINCRIDAYNDCTASYDHYNYRMCGMIVGRCAKTTTINGSNYPDLSQYNMTFNNVTVNYGMWMNYHYCDPTPGLSNSRGMRVEPGYAYDGIPADYDHTQCTTNHYECIPFDQLIGGDQYGVKGLREVEGVTVNYPTEYLCPLCGEKHNVNSGSGGEITVNTGA